MKEKIKLFLAVLPKGALAYMGVVFAIALFSGLSALPLSASDVTPVAVSALGGVFGRIVINVMLSVSGLKLPFSDDWGKGGIALGVAIILVLS